MQKHLFNYVHQAVGNCEHVNFFTHGVSQYEMCTLAKTECGYQYQFVNMFELTYCWLQGYWMVATFLQFVFILMVFRFIQAVVEEYLAPAIAYLSEWLQLPEALGAVTLLALANGAGDVVTAIVASSENGGLSYNVGAIYGAGLFVCSIVVAMTISNSAEDIQLPANTIWRDVGFYILSTVVVIGFAVQGELTVISAIALLLIYVLMVLVVWFQERNNFDVTHSSSSQQPENGEEEPQQDGSIKKEQQQTPEQKAKALEQKQLVFFPEDKTDEEQQAYPKKWRNVLNKLNTATGKKRNMLLMQKFKNTVYLMMKMQKKADDDAVAWKEMSWQDKAAFIVDQPFFYMRRFTLPPAEQDKYERIWGSIWPILCLPFIYCCLAPQVKLYVVGVLIALGAILALILYKTQPAVGIPKYYPLLQVFGTIGSITWTYLVCGILIDILQFLGMVSKLNKTYLGLTVIAVGNALPDAVTTIALAKQGYAVMGLTGAYAGQLFGLLIGFGLALMKKTVSEGPQVFNLFELAHLKDNFMNIFVIMVSLLNLVITFVFGVTHSYQYTKVLAKIIGSLYAVFVLVSTIAAVIEAFDDDDLTTATIFKFCVNNEQEFAFVRKYQYRMIVSVVLDCVIFPLIVLGGNQFIISSLELYICIGCFILAAFIHLIAFLNIQTLTVESNHSNNCLTRLSKVCVCMECCCVFLCSYSRCMLLDVDQCAQQTLILVAEERFRAYNFYAAGLAYLGFFAGVLQIRKDHLNNSNMFMPFLAIALWMLLDLIRLSWFCIKAVKKIEAKALIDKEDIIKPPIIQQENNYRQVPSIHLNL